MIQQTNSVPRVEKYKKLGCENVIIPTIILFSGEFATFCQYLRISKFCFFIFYFFLRKSSQCLMISNTLCGSHDMMNYDFSSVPTVQ